MRCVNTLSCHPDIFIHQYLATASLMRCRDIQTFPFAYNYDAFHNCSNYRHVTAPSRALVSNSSSVPTHPTFHHYFIHFLQPFFLLYLLTTTQSNSNLFIFRNKLLGFLLILLFLSFSSLLYPWYGRTLHNFAFETTPFHYRITSSFSFSFIFTLHNTYTYILSPSVPEPIVFTYSFVCFWFTITVYNIFALYLS